MKLRRPRFGFPATNHDYYRGLRWLPYRLTHEKRRLVWNVLQDGCTAGDDGLIYSAHGMVFPAAEFTFVDEGGRVWQAE